MISSISVTVPEGMKEGHYLVEDVHENRTIAFWSGDSWAFIGDEARYDNNLELSMKVLGLVHLDA
jgi:hypothetical protein